MICLKNTQGTILRTGLQSALSEFGLNGKLSAVSMTTNAANMNCARRKCPWSDLGCFGDTLQLCIKPGLQQQRSDLGCFEDTLQIVHKTRSPTTECIQNGRQSTQIGRAL